jgi:hypothetical protein
MFNNRHMSASSSIISAFFVFLLSRVVVGMINFYKL